jgi:uncharacterized RDD family membrane protein YckC
MALSSENPYAPPAAAVADVVPESADMLLATRWRRLAGAVLDGIINSLLYFPIQALLGRSVFRPPPDMGLGYLATNVLIGTAIYLLINGWLLVDRGQTLAKMLLGTRIVRPDGAKVGAGRIALRWLATTWVGLVPLVGAIYSLVDCLMIFRKSRRCLHDLIADTIVIRV